MARGSKNQTSFDFDSLSNSLLSDFETGEKIKRKPPEAKPENPPEAVVEEPAKSDEGEIAQEEQQVLSVSQLNAHIKGLLEGEFPVVWIKGEISNFKIPPSGHFYFSLKDDKAQVRAVMFKGHNSKLRFDVEGGMEVIVRARVSVYAPRGDYQIICDQMEPVGQGALQIAFEQLKKKLQSEGLFDQARKKALPALPKRVALVTSPTGAAIRDMLNVLSRRFKGLDITVIPTSVQGDKAPAEIVSAIQVAQKVKPAFDVMIIGRGGGSIEDLWSFNEEIVARAIAECSIPTVSAVGHEVDFTIADFVADLRAPTPSAGAELIVRNKSELQDRVVSLSKRLQTSVLSLLRHLKQETVGYSKRLVDPQVKLQELIQRNDELVERMQKAALRNIRSMKDSVSYLTRSLGRPEKFLERARERLKSTMALLDSFSPLKVVERGYSIVTKDNKVVKSVDSLDSGDSINIRFAKGEAEASITKLKK